MSSGVSKIFSRSRSLMYKGYTFNLLATNTLTCGILLAGGDVITQRIERIMGHSESYDASRSGKIFIKNSKSKSLLLNMFFRSNVCCGFESRAPTSLLVLMVGQNATKN